MPKTDEIEAEEVDGAEIEEVVEADPKDVEADKALAGIKLLLELFEAVDGAQRVTADESDLVAAVRRGIAEVEALDG